MRPHSSPGREALIGIVRYAKDRDPGRGCCHSRKTSRHAHGGADLAALPIELAARTWGGEIYFDAPVSSAAEPDARVTVKAGDIVFWPEGDAISIGFGPTPLSRTRGEIRLAGPCNVWAEALDDVRQLKSVHTGVAISVSEAEC